MSVKHSLELNASNQLTRWHCFVFCLFVGLFVGQVSYLNPKICNSPKGWSVLFLSFQFLRKTNNFKTTNSNLHQPIKKVKQVWFVYLFIVWLVKIQDLYFSNWLRNSVSKIYLVDRKNWETQTFSKN